MKTLEITKILLINLAYIGDVILSTPMIQKLRETYPNATIHMMVIPGTSEVIKGNPNIDKVIIYDKRGLHRKIHKVLPLIKELRQENYDVAFAMNYSVRTPIMAFLSGAKERIGFKKQKGELFLTRIINPKNFPVDLHITDFYMQLLLPLNIPIETKKMQFTINDSSRKKIKEVLECKGYSNKPILVVCPFGRSPLKTWDNGKLVTTLNKIEEELNVQIAFIGGAENKEQLQILSDQVKHSWFFAGTLSLQEVAAFFDISKAMLTVDTGPMHLAVAVGLPVVALFGPTSPSLWKPIGTCHSTIYKNITCPGCGGSGATDMRACNNNHLCMQSISTEEVYCALKSKLA